MALLINAQDLSKRYGAAPLFEAVSLRISEGDRLGLIGPNGSGKSTLLEIIAGRRDPDTGEVALRKNTRLSYVAQDPVFQAGNSVRSVIQGSLRLAKVPQSDWAGREAEVLGRANFIEFDVEATTLSGGWRKRLAIAAALVQQPDVLLLDEPTNHLDIAGIEWLEKTLTSSSMTCIVVSHDRYFLENVATEMAELNRVYPAGLYRVQGSYTAFLEAKQAYLHAQAKHQDALENRVRTEIEWLRRGPKARATKAKARIDNAHALIGELADLQSRSRTTTAGIDFSESNRKTKRLVELQGVSYGYDQKTLFQNLDLTITAGMRVGLAGPNGSGKTTLLQLLRGALKPEAGSVKQAESLRIVYFDQNRELDPTLTLRRALAPDGDSVVYQERVIHVASWAARFLFTSEQLNQPVSRLSGGERARVLIAKLMLEPADLLLLDEPTNDLDIPTLEVLEESLLEFRGALVLVTHDRYMLDRVSTVVFGLDGQGGAQAFADYSQWDAWQTEGRQARTPEAGRKPDPLNGSSSAAKKKLSYLDQREYQSIEERVTEAEELLEARRQLLEQQVVVTDPKRLQETYALIEEAQQSVDELYSRWAELEGKKS